VVLERDGALWRTVDLVARPGSTADGRVYGIKRKLPAGNWSYRFIAADDGGRPAIGTPTLPHPGPKIMSPPYLVWCDEEGYGDGDGVEPNAGYDMVDRVFKVIYRDHEGDLARYVRVALWRDGGWFGSFAMAPPSPPLDPVAGLNYTLTKKLAVGTYQYQFQAADRHGTAGGPASVKTGGLEVIAAVPILTWTGEQGFKDDGVAPNFGEPDETRFRFRVTLTDPDGNEPEYVRLILRQNGEQWKGVMMRAGSGTPLTGRIYWLTMRLPLGNYAYRFRAKDEDGYGEGEPVDIRPGPIMSAPPFLIYSADPGYENVDGVEPNTGEANDTRFEFRCIYKSHDGDAPAWVKVRLLRDGSRFRTYSMVAYGSTLDPVVGGIVYRLFRKLPAAGSYSYQFLGQDWRGENASGPATAKLANLTVTSGGASAITSLSAVPTNAGTQITFSLASAAQIQARILNMAGRPIKTLCQAKNCEAGTNTLLWNAQSENGLAVPNGVYLVEVMAKAADGSQGRALAQVRLNK
jgi:hypothetical protein